MTGETPPTAMTAIAAGAVIASRCRVPALAPYAVDAFAGALWAERCANNRSDSEVDVRWMVGYRDGCLRVLATCTGDRASAWLDVVRAVDVGDPDGKPE